MERKHFPLGPAVFSYPKLVRDDVLSDTLRKVVLAIVLTRSSLDPIFEIVNFGSSGSGVGGILNSLVILIAVTFVVCRTYLLPAWTVWMWAPYLGICAATLVLAPEFGLALRLYLSVLSYAAFFFFPFFILRHSSDLSRFLAVTLCSAIIPVSYGLLTAVASIGDPDARVQGTFAHPNILAFFLVLQIALVLFVQVSTAIAWSARTRRLILLALPVLVLLLLETKTRSAWGAAGALFFIFAIWCDRRVLLVLLLSPLALLFDVGITERLSDLQGGLGAQDLDQLDEETRVNSYVWRVVLWSSSMPWFWERPLFGYGIGAFRFFSTEFFPLLIDGQGVDAHSLYVQTMFEVGIIGLLALLLVFAAACYQLLKGRQYDRLGTVIMLGIVATYLIEAYSDNIWYYLSFNCYFYFVLGSMCAWLRLEKTKSDLHRGRAAP